MSEQRNVKEMSGGAKMAEGIAIIAAKEPAAEACAHHDKLFFGNADRKALKSYTKEERKRLRALGWFVDEESWAFFT